jgi:hypothetical protein
MCRHERRQGTRGRARHALLLTVATSIVLLGQTPPPPGTGVPSNLFPLHQLDLHLHAGMERRVDLATWLDMAAADGRKVVVLLDHLELYRRTPEEYAAWREKEKLTQPAYALGPAGHRQLFAQFDAMAAARRDLVIFKGWEIFEGELETGMDLEAMRLVDVVGWHISPNNGRQPPDGQALLRRVRQVKAAQKQVPVPMILFHPFTMRIENIKRTAKAAGRDVAAITPAEYRFFHGDEQKQLAEELRGSSIYIEIGRGTGNDLRDPAAREALIADIRPLAEMGVQFTVSTDAHTPANLKATFRPEEFCGPLGVTPANTNTLVRELLAQRAIKSVAH